jgi:hypothetical protein
MPGRLRRVSAVLILLAPVTGMGAQKPAAPQPPAAQKSQKKTTESFWDKVLRVSGISHDPSTLKGPGDEVVSGEIWLAAAGFDRTQKLTATAGYRCPVFIPQSNDILALKAADVVRVARAGGKATKLYTINGITKLIGFSLDDPDKVLALTEAANGDPGVGMLSLGSGMFTALAYNPTSSRDRKMLEHLQSWDRVYGDESVYLKRQSKESLAGTVEWTDVYLKAGSNQPVDASQCDSVNCGQPSLSADGKLVVFIKAVPE